MALLKNKYMPLSEANVSPERVASYDGQHITLTSSPGLTALVLGDYLGGGIAGVVYEAFDQRTKRPVAVKILNPVGYKLTNPGTLRRGEIIKKGFPVVGHVRGMTLDNVYWVHLPRRRDLVACYVSGTPPVLRELTLEMCVRLWLLDETPPPTRSDRSEDPVQGQDGEEVVVVNEVAYMIPSLPAKYRAFVQARKSIYREIAHMHKLTGNSISGERIGSGHENVLQLYDVLEFVQPSKSTIFLVLELAYGGELFDRIRGDAGVEEAVARRYFAQLLAGVRYCHHLGIVHRDLKPENLLLSDADVLKIADFGLSAHFIAAVSSGEHENANESHASLLASSRFRRLNSIVGSPHYVAPEVLHNARYGYDGRKADMWSCGVILYGLLVGTLPFGRDLATCPRYLKFGEWLRSLPYDPHSGKFLYDTTLFHSNGEPLETHGRPLWSPKHAASACSSPPSDARAAGPSRRAVAFPSWFFPTTLSPSAVFLLASLLHPDPSKRISCEEACKSSWMLDG